MNYDYLKRLQSYDPEIIQDFRLSKKSTAIPPELQKFILQLEAVMEIRADLKTDNISRAAKELCARFPEINFRVARTRVYDALSFFHYNEPVANQVWDNVYADKMEDLARVAMSKGDHATALKCYERAHEYRTKAETRIRAEDIKPPVFIVSNKMNIETLGFKNKNLKEVARKASEGAYHEMISKLNITKEEKRSILKDLSIEVDYEDAE